MFLSFSSLFSWPLKHFIFSDWKVSTADYFSRSNRRGSVVSEVDDVSIPDLTSVSVLHGGGFGVSGLWLTANTLAIWKLGT